MQDIHASAETTQNYRIELLLKHQIDSEKEKSSKPKHETHIMRLGTSKYMSMSRGKGAAHMVKGTREKCATRLKTKKGRLWKVAILSQNNKKMISLLVSSNYMARK